VRALVLEEGAVYRSHHPDPQPGPGEALVRVILAGVCRTDLEILRGYLGFRGIAGHEFVGVVEHSPAPSWVGRRVVGEINCACGRCATCRAGRSRHCPHRTVLGIQGRDGAFADYLTLPLANLHTVPEGLSDEEAVFVEPLAAAFEILEQVEVTPSDRVVVVGDGKLGLLVVQVLRERAGEVTLVGRHDRNVVLARSLGVEAVFADRAQVLAGADVVADCSGTASGWELARRLVRPCGRLILKSTFAQEFFFHFNFFFKMCTRYLNRHNREFRIGDQFHILR